MEYLPSDAAKFLSDVTAGWTHPVSHSLHFNLIATGLFFSMSFLHKNSSIYDPYWSVFPPLMALCYAGHSVGSPWLWLSDPSAFIGSLSTRQMLILALVGIYGARLTINWMRRLGWDMFFGDAMCRDVHEDWRYKEVREKPLALFRKFLPDGASSALCDLIWWGFSSPALIHLYPTISIFLGCMPLYFSLTLPATQAFGPADIVAAVVLATGIALEAIADLQMDAFLRTDAAKKGGVCSNGLWSISRHPNYLGEQTFWLGVWLFAWAAKGQSLPGAVLLSSVGFFQVVLLFLTASIPWMEQRQSQRRPKYREYKKKVAMLVPFVKC